MIHSTRTETQRQYEYTGTNQHGNRYKIKGRKDIRVLNLSVLHNDSSNTMFEFMALCASLDIPPTWATIDGRQRMSIDIVAKKSVM